MEHEFQIEEKDIPKRPGRRASLTYPIAQLEAGSEQCFTVPATTETVKKVLTSIRTYAYRNGFRVILRQSPYGVDVWRKK